MLYVEPFLEPVAARDYLKGGYTIDKSLTGSLE
jgi:hypothetical protein